MPLNRGHSALVLALLAATDVLCILAATVLATTWIEPASRSWDLGAYLAVQAGYVLGFLVAWPFAASANRLYISRRRDDLVSLVFDITKSVALALIFSGFVVAFYTPRGAEPEFISTFGLTVLALIGVFRMGLQLALWSIRRQGHDEKYILIVGVNERARELILALNHNRHYGYRITGVLEDDPERFDLIADFNLKSLGNFGDLEDALLNNVVDEVYICLPVRSQYQRIQEMAHLCEGIGVAVRMIADLFPLRLATSRFHKLEGIPILALSTVPENQPQLLIQRVTDILLAGFALVAASPIFLFTAIAIKLESPGPVFFAQERVGLNRRRFKMVKFRSMVKDAEALRAGMESLNEKEGPIFKTARDPRVTRVGKFIRKYSIDELPQLINVLVGQMSLVGPRPPLPAEVEHYSWNQRRRLSVKPGMTGLSQVSGRSDLSFTDTVDLDLYYIDQWSIALVFRILLMTIPTVLRGRGAM